MDATWLGFLSQIVAGVVIAMVTAVVTVRLSLRSFYSERWWERKAEAYTAVIESLHHMKRYDDTMLELTYEGRELAEERKNELLERSQKAYDEFKRLMDVGSFVLAPDAMEELRTLEKEFRKAGNAQTWHDHLEISLAATQVCLDNLRQIGRKDLKVG